MPRNMSFALTTEQFKNQTKTVTRRTGWKFLKAGDLIMGCKKCMGLKPGEQIERLGLIRITSVSTECLFIISDDEVHAEGFPDKDSAWFIRMFTEHMGGDAFQDVTRIGFEYI